MQRLRAILFWMLLGAAPTPLLQGQTVESYTFTGNRAVPDGNAAGLSDVRNVNSVISAITSVKVRLKITGEFNGDLYASVRHSSGLAVLLNRAGRTAANVYGYPDSGFDVTFQTGATNGDVHLYRNVATPSDGMPLTGIWEPDGRNVDPANATDASARSGSLTNFNGINADGQWTLYLADVDSGGTNMLAEWSLEIAGAAYPTLAWAKPADIGYGTALSATQLNATATCGSTNVPGTFTYTPAAGTRLNAGSDQTLSVDFAPAATTRFWPIHTNVSINVLKAPLTITANDTNKAYGTALPGFTARYTGFVNGEDAGVLTGNPDLSTSANIRSPVGSYPIMATAGTLSADNYSLIFADGQLFVAPAVVTATIRVGDRTYDGTTAATITSRSLSGAIGGDNVSLTGGTAAFADKNVGNSKTVAVTGLDLSGADAGNYLLAATTATTTANITAAVLTVSAAGLSKVYDGTTNATVMLSDDRVNGDEVIDTCTRAVFATKHTGNGKPVTAYGVSISGTDAGNYTLASTTATATADITARPITVTAASNTKTYDGTISSAAAPAITSGTVQGSDTANFMETYDDKNTGTGKSLRPAGTVNDGNAGNNYSVTFVNDTTGVIRKRPLTVTAVANSKNYDGTANAVATPTITGGTLQGSDTASFSESYDSKNTGIGKTLTPGGAVDDGNGGNNYTYIFNNNTMGAISARALTVMATANTKAYDGTTSATAAPTITAGAVQTGDTANFLEAYGTKTVGAGKTLAPGGSVNDGNGGNNYSYAFVNNYEGVITSRGLTVSGVTANNKVYDGNTTATLSTSGAALVGVVGGDAIVLAGTATGTFASANAGAGKTVSVSGLTIGGADSGNYSLTPPAATADITARNLTVLADNKMKTCGFPNPPLTAWCSGWVNGEGTNVLSGSPSLSTTATTGCPEGNYPIAATSGTLSALNYSFSFVDGTLSVVAPPRLSNGWVNGNRFVLTCPTIAGQRYQVEYSDDLRITNWTPLGITITGAGVPLSVTNDSEAVGYRFFRVQVLP